MLNPQLYNDHEPIEAREAMMLLMYAGWGCTMRINGEFNGSFDHKLWKWEEENKDKLQRAGDIWKLPRVEILTDYLNR